MRNRIAGTLTCYFKTFFCFLRIKVYKLKIMKKTEAELASLFEEQVSFIFEDFKKLPNYGQANPTFLARPRKSDTYNKIKEVLSHLKSNVEVESSKFKIQGPKSIIGKAIGGVGDENDTEAWATEENLKTEAQRMYVVLEVMKILYEK